MADDYQKQDELFLSIALELSKEISGPKSIIKRHIGRLLTYNSLGSTYLKTEVTKYLKTRNVPRILNYAVTTIPEYSDEEFRARFRMLPSTYKKLYQFLEPYIKIKYIRETYIPVESQILAYIFYASTQVPMIRVADVFGISEATVCNIVSSLSEIINKELMPKFMQWPVGLRVREVTEGFEHTQGFPNVLGAIDGTHIPIKAPTEYPENYINRKSYHSINVAAVCDHEHFFTDIHVGWPGSTHDARVFQNSPLRNALEMERYNLIPENCHIIGDSAYALEEYLMVPFRDNGRLTPEQRLYNFKHSSTRMKIEHSFGILKCRFRRLKYIDMLDMNKVVAFISSCFVLHNVCLATGDFFDDLLEETQNGDDDLCEPIQPQQPTATAQVKRQALMQILS